MTYIIDIQKQTLVLHVSMQILIKLGKSRRWQALKSQKSLNSKKPSNKSIKMLKKFLYNLRQKK